MFTFPAIRHQFAAQRLMVRWR